MNLEENISSDSSLYLEVVDKKTICLELACPKRSCTCGHGVESKTGGASPNLLAAKMVLRLPYFRTCTLLRDEIRAAILIIQQNLNDN